MLSFRFHIVSLVAVFLALAIGIIMGSTVIDRALVDTLEDQQQSLRGDLDRITEENASLRSELGDLRETSERLANEGGERLLAGTLADVPVLVIASRGVETTLLDELAELLEVAGADDEGTLWLTDRFALEDDGTAADLAEALGLPGSTSPDRLRDTALDRVAAAVRTAVAPEEGGAAPGAEGGTEGTTPDGVAPGEEGSSGEEVPPEEVSPEGPGATTSTTEVVDAGEALAVLVELRDAGFLEFDAPEGEDDDLVDLATAGTRVVLVSGAGAEVADEAVALPLARALVTQEDVDAPGVPLLAAEALPASEEAEGEPPGEPFVELLREGDVADRLSTVDNLDDFAGRLATVLALQDLGEGRRGHYGVGPGAQRLVPAPGE